MKKLISKLKNKSSRGFTVAEVVVALTIIVLVSGSSLLTFAVQARVEAKTAQTFEATNIAENAIECFIYADGDVGTFKTAFNEKSGYTLEGDGPYTVTKGSVNATITIENKEIKITVANSSGEILSKNIKLN